MKPLENTWHQFLANFTYWPPGIWRKKKKTGFGFSFADPFKKIRMLQGTPKKKKKKKKSSPFISHSASKFLQTTKIISTNPKSAILYYSIIHQKEKSFVNQVSCKFKYMLFTKKKPNLFRKKKKKSLITTAVFSNLQLSGCLHNSPVCHSQSWPEPKPDWALGV